MEAAIERRRRCDAAIASEGYVHGFVRPRDLRIAWDLRIAPFLRILRTGARGDTRAMRFATRVFLMQLSAAGTVVAICVAAAVMLGVGQLREEAESTSLAVARTVANDPSVRELVAQHAGETVLDAAALAAGPLQTYAMAITDSAETLFVVIANDRGRRLAHPNPELLGGELSTEYARVLAGEEVVAWEEGTLGVSVRAKVPVRAPDGSRVVGEVSVGFAPAHVFAGVPVLLALLGGVAALAVAVAATVSWRIRRYLERLTRGVQPEEIGTLLQSRAVVLAGLQDGVIAVDADGVVRACNPAATAALDLGEALGAPVAALQLPVRLRAAMMRALDGTARVPGELVLGEQVLYFEVRRVLHDRELLGAVAVLRDRTDVVALAHRLDAVRAATDALRAQRHEFANRMHAVGGMLAAGRVEQARELLGELVDRGTLPEEEGLEVGEPFLSSFLAAKRIGARERGVELRLGEDTLVLGTVAEAEDVAAVLGNLIDNAVTAAARAPAPRWVEVVLLDDGAELALTVADSGGGVDRPEGLFERAREAEDNADAAALRPHGHGIGLPLARRFARRRGGELWLAEAEGPGRGAVFAARLPGAMLSTATPGSAESPVIGSGR